MTVTSPLTYKRNVAFVKAIPCEEIIRNYLKIYKTDVSGFFKGLMEIKIYKCLDTGYLFYFPLNIDGDGEFYKNLQDFEWYYMGLKWEHAKAYSLINRSDKVLEIGSGRGKFIEKLSSIGINCKGLELNEDAVRYAKSRYIPLIHENVQSYAKNNIESYDIVCSFQVMEHIANIREVLESSVSMLKKGGRLIISVPNNDSFLGLDSKNYLNMPPHHMGLWNESSLKNLTKCFDIKLKHIYFEPLQHYHRKYFTKVMQGHINKNLQKVIPHLQLSSGTVKRLTPFFSNRIKAFTIQAIFEKQS